MKYPIYQVDAFAVQPFKGNPAAVCILEKPKEADWMQSVAAEMNLSETAFLYAKKDDYELRWFTPTTEVDLCGHCTLASAHILYESGFYDPDETINFHTKSGLITSTFSRGTIELDMPRLDFELTEPSAELLDVLGASPVSVANSGSKLILVELENSDAVKSFVPDIKKISALEVDLLITSLDESGKYDFISRFFAPTDGIFEDPVTGMAHCVLGPYWAPKLKKTSFHAYQASARGGEVWVSVEPNRVLLGGKAVTVMQGELVHQK